MGLEGNLTDMSLLDILRIFQRSAGSGKLIVWNTSEWALVLLLKGQVVNAIVLTRPDRQLLHVGEDAIHNLLNWSDGQFRYSSQAPGDNYQITIQKSTHDIIVTALKRRRAAALPATSQWTRELTLETTLSIVHPVSALNEQIMLKIDEWAVLARIGRQTTIQQLAAQFDLPTEQILQIIAHLIECGLVTRLLLADLPPRRLTIDPPAFNGDPSYEKPVVTNLTRAIRRRLHQVGARA